MATARPWLLVKPPIILESTTAEHEADDVVVRYRIYADGLGDRTRHVDSEHAFLNPAAVFIYAEGFRNANRSQHRLALVAGSKRDGSTGTGRFVAPI